MYIEEATYLMTDKEYVEGIIGGLGWIVAMYFLKKYLNNSGGNMLIGGLLSWCILWYIRKIGVRWYMLYKRSYTDKEDFSIKAKVFLFFIIVLASVYILTEEKEITLDEIIVITIIILLLFETEF